MNPNDITKALWAQRQPDDSWMPTSWVRVYTWRGERTVIIVTELETYDRIERRVDGHTQVAGQTEYLVQGGALNAENVQAAMTKIV